VTGAPISGDHDVRHRPTRDTDCPTAMAVEPRADPTPSGVAALSLRLPPYWPSDPEVWFAQVEAQFSTRGITAQRTKFEYIVASLSPEYATEVRDLILHPPDTRPYDSLREQLVKRTAASDQRRLQQLLHSEELGDRKPSQLLRRMQQLLGDSAAATDSSFVRGLFIQRLPANVRMVLASAAASTSLEDLAHLADRIVEAAPPQLASLRDDPSQSSPTPEVEQLRAEVKRLADKVATLSTQERPSRRRSLTPRRSPSPARTMLCWYHEKFGDAARKCRPPCSKAGNDRAGR
jgi:hypothetical protein